MSHGVPGGGPPQHIRSARHILSVIIKFGAQRGSRMLLGANHRVVLSLHCTVAAMYSANGVEFCLTIHGLGKKQPEFAICKDPGLVHGTRQVNDENMQRILQICKESKAGLQNVFACKLLHSASSCSCRTGARVLACLPLV